MQAPSSPSPEQPFVVTVVPATAAPERTVGDVIIGSLAVVGALLVMALVLGVLFAGVRVLWRRTHPLEAEHMPPVKPTTDDLSARPSSPVR